MAEYRIEIATAEECRIVDQGIVAYNHSKVPFSQDPAFIPFRWVIRDGQGTVLAGIIASMYCWNCVYVDVLWVTEDRRGKGLGSRLLGETERFARENGCHLIHLDTFDFQAKQFYEKHGYEVFGVLNDCPPGHKRYYMKKEIS